MYARTATICFLLLSLRAWARIWFSFIWAEDGKVFITEGLRWGWSSLLIPHAGSYHTIQRIVAYGVASFVPVPLWALVITLFNLMVLALVASRIVSKDFEWIFPARKVRVAIALLLCFAPGLLEMAGNLANLNWVLFYWLALLALRDLNRKMHGWEFWVAVLILFSVGTSLLLIPLFVWRFWKTRDRADAALLGILVLENIWLVLLNGMHLSVQDASPQNRAGFSPLHEMVEKGIPILVQTFNKTVLWRPWVGPGFATRWTALDHHSWITFLILCAAYGYLLREFFRHRRENWAQAIALLTVGIFVWPALRFIGRSGSIGDVMYLNPWYWSLRFSYPHSFLAILLWMAVFRSFPMRFGRWPSVALIFLILSFVHCLDRFWIGAYEGPVPLWGKSAAQLEEAMKKGEFVRAPIAPFGAEPGWYIEYPGRIKNGS